MPANAVTDLTEWDLQPGDGIMDAAYLRLNGVLSDELDLDQLIAASPNTPSVTDDRPTNEYYILRKWAQRWRRAAGH